MRLPLSLALAIASCLATLAETLLFNTITVRRTRVQAGKKPSRASPFHAMQIQLICLLLRRPWTLVASTLLRNAGVPAFLAGCVAGLVEGVVFTPTRRLATVQLASAQPAPVRALLSAIVGAEGWRGLWLGWKTNAVRTSLGAGAYFAAVAAAQQALPEASTLIHGAIGSGVATLVLNPFEVVLAVLYTGRAAQLLDGRSLARGLGLSLARNVPGGAVRWWLTQLGAAALTGG